jgi:hypothetical protein
MKKCIEFDEHKGEISVANSVTRLKTKEKSALLIHEESRSIASHFYEIHKAELKQETTSSPLC